MCLFKLFFGNGSYGFSWQRAVKRVHCCYLLVYLTKETLKTESTVEERERDISMEPKSLGTTE